MTNAFFVTAIAVLVLPANLILSGCTTVPAYEEASGGIPVGAIVERTKCQLADAFDDRVDKKPFLWLADWTAKVDLTLQVNDQASVTPTGAYVEPLKNGYGVIAGATSLGGSTIGAIAQNFTIGAGAGLTDQSARTEIVSFTLSLKELKTWRDGIRSKVNADPNSLYASVCAPSHAADLVGGLGLDEWIASALMPVAEGQLQAGDHPAPKTSVAPAASGPAPQKFSLAYDKISCGLIPFGGSPPPPPNPEKDAVCHSFNDTVDDVARINKALSAIAADVTSAQTSLDASRADLRHSKFRYVLSPDYQDRLNGDIANLHAALHQTKVASGNASVYQVTGSTILDQVNKIYAQDHISKDDVTTATNDKASADMLASQTDTALAAAADAKALATQTEQLVAKSEPNPPIDSISHQVQFVVMTSASVSPSWTFVRFHGPTGPLAGVNGTRTHTLIIALGPRGDGGAGSLEQQRALNTQYLTNIATSLQR